MKNKTDIVTAKKQHDKKSCMNCKLVDICIFRIKLHTEFSPILRSGLSHQTLNKVYEVFANDCDEYKKQKYSK